MKKVFLGSFLLCSSFQVFAMDRAMAPRTYPGPQDRGQRLSPSYGFPSADLSESLRLAVVADDMSAFDYLTEKYKDNFTDRMVAEVLYWSMDRGRLGYFEAIYDCCLKKSSFSFRNKGDIYQVFCEIIRCGLQRNFSVSFDADERVEPCDVFVAVHYFVNHVEDKIDGSLAVSLLSKAVSFRMEAFCRVLIAKFQEQIADHAKRFDPSAHTITKSNCIECLLYTLADEGPYCLNCRFSPHRSRLTLKKIITMIIMNDHFRPFVGPLARKKFAIDAAWEGPAWRDPWVDRWLNQEFPYEGEDEGE